MPRSKTWNWLLAPPLREEPERAEAAPKNPGNQHS
jgi:hypothetical protein